jgi:hypothetical protein
VLDRPPARHGRKVQLGSSRIGIRPHSDALQGIHVLCRELVSQRTRDHQVSVPRVRPKRVVDVACCGYVGSSSDPAPRGHDADGRLLVSLTQALHLIQELLRRERHHVQGAVDQSGGSCSLDDAALARPIRALLMPAESESVKCGGPIRFDPRSATTKPGKAEVRTIREVVDIQGRSWSV